MTMVTPARRALVDLPVNTLSAPSGTVTMYSAQIGQKRPFWAIQEPENHVSPSRTQLLKPSEESLRVEPSQTQSTTVFHNLAVAPAYSPLSETASSPAKPEAQGAEDSQTSCKDSPSPLNDFDLDDSMTSQQTEATEHAETLRLRLRLAHFKIRTNQVDVPFAQLRVSMEDKQDAQSLRESTVQPGEHPPLPRLLPAPALQPTAYSARTVIYSHKPFCPLVSPVASTARVTEDDVFKTPAVPGGKASAEVQQLSSPPDSQEDHIQGNKEALLNSSAVKGSAAISLLGLGGQQCITR
ncbi:MAG: hypothetical protein Q9217_005606 [Psora testacea]